MELLASEITAASGITSHGMELLVVMEWNHWPAESLQPTESLVIILVIILVTTANGIT